jgi:beta-aspartyl-peptidase (threonine type)
VRKPVIAVHGGAGTWRRERRSLGLAGVKEAASVGFETLAEDGTALAAVESAVACMEDNSVFNAGLGSALAIDQRIEMEASIMDGRTLNAGAVSLLRDVKNPVRLARIVMENTDHVFVAGEGAELLADLFGLERADPTTELRVQYWRELKRKLVKGEWNYLPKLRKLITSHRQLFELGTVGAVALDMDENMAAATSTGGFSLKFPGRIGDSPLIGCGTYADNASGACSTTGIGEVAIRLVLAKTACDFVENGGSAQEAAENSIRLVNLKMNLAFMGLIVVDKFGRVGAAHNSPNLCWAYMTTGTRQPKAAMKAESVEAAD